eukprot:3932891-Rhodomonas_salina.2
MLCLRFDAVLSACRVLVVSVSVSQLVHVHRDRLRPRGLAVVKHAQQAEVRVSRHISRRAHILLRPLHQSIDGVCRQQNPASVSPPLLRLLLSELIKLLMRRRASPATHMHPLPSITLPNPIPTLRLRDASVPLILSASSLHPQALPRQHFSHLHRGTLDAVAETRHI